MQPLKTAVEKALI